MSPSGCLNSYTRALWSFAVLSSCVIPRLNEVFGFRLATLGYDGLLVPSWTTPLLMCCFLDNWALVSLFLFLQVSQEPHVCVEF